MLKEETLLDFIEGRLTANERLAVEDHLSRCDRCLEETLIMQGMASDDRLAEFDPAPRYLPSHTLEKLRNRQPERSAKVLSNAAAGFRKSVERLVTTLTFWRQEAFAPVRGTQNVVDKELIILKKSFRELDVNIEIDKKGPGWTSIRVLLVKGSASGQAIRATLFKDDRELSSYLLNTSPAFFEKVPFGRYALVFTVNGFKKGEYLFELKESQNGEEQLG